MALTLTEALAKEWMTLDADTRQQGFFEYLSSTLSVWGVVGDSGWIMFQHEEGEFLPLWSHEILAKLWLQQHHPEATATQISLHTFKTEWLPGLAKNSVGVVVSPSDSNDDAIYMTAEEVMDAVG